MPYNPDDLALILALTHLNVQEEINQLYTVLWQVCAPHIHHTHNNKIKLRERVAKGDTPSVDLWPPHGGEKRDEKKEKKEKK